jgi:hypothetical protein
VPIGDNGLYPLDVTVGDDVSLNSNAYVVEIEIRKAEAPAVEESADELALAREATEEVVADSQSGVYDLEEDDDVQVQAPPPVIPPVVIPKNAPPRKNVPITVIAYEDPESMFLREEPSLRKMEFGKKGDMGMGFSGDMVYPDEWKQKFESDSATLAAEKNGTLKGRRRLQAVDQIQFYLKKPNKNKLERISKDDIMFIGLDPNKLTMKLKFARPELVSLGSQSDPDEIVMKFAKDFVLNDVNGNSLVFDSGETTADSIDMNIPLQT